jgi:hypothetical protein
MRKAVVMLLSALLFETLAYAQVKPGLLEAAHVNGSWGMDYYSSYIWRGFVLDNDPVLQPAVYLSRGNINMSFWSSWDFGSRDALNSGEADVSLDYTQSFQYLNVSLGHIYYHFPGAQSYSNEVYLGVQLKTLPLLPNVVYYNDYTTGDGSYFSIDLVKTFLLRPYPMTGLSIGLHKGFNNSLYINGSGGDLGLVLDAGFMLSGTLNSSLVLGYSIPEGDLKDASDGDQEEKLYAGIRLGAGF